jgi:GNAT superfamily N-acetyltransferase
MRGILQESDELRIRRGSAADLDALVAVFRGERFFFGDCLAKQHLEVLGPVQRRGIGTALIRAGEATARKLGQRRVALGVGLDNPDARRLYERLGYTDWGHGSVAGTYQDRDRGGPPVTITETIAMLVKRL